MIRSATFILLLVTSTNFAAAVEAVRIATCNVYCGNRRYDELAEAIAQAEADIVCLQETTATIELALQDRLKGQFSVFHAAEHEGRVPAERFALLANRPLRNVRFVPPREGMFGFLVAEMQVGDKFVTITSVHLTPFLVDRTAKPWERVAALARTEDVHGTEIEAVLAQVDMQEPAIIAGDFNSLSPSKAPQALLAAGMTDAVAAVHDDAEKLTTWRIPTRHGVWQLRIDYVFASSHFQVKSADVIAVPGSDHRLVVAELQLEEAAEQATK